MRMSSRQATTNTRRHRPDYTIVLVCGLLMLIGLIVIYALGPALETSARITVGKQFISVFLGALAFGATAVIPLSFWHRVQPVLIVLALVTSAILLLPETPITPVINGATRWIVIGPVSFQPSELLKFTLVVYTATFLARRERLGIINNVHETMMPLVGVLAFLGLLVAGFQSDLGTAIVVVSIMLGMLFIGGVPIKYIGGLIGGLFATAGLAIMLVPERVERVLTFLNPSADLEGAGFHINNALIAIGSGGLFGLGLGKSVQAYGYLPEAANDSIFAIYAEKFGFIGVLVIFALYGALLFRIIKVVEHSPNFYMRLVACGVFAWIASHAIVNTAAMLGLMPLTGITLPLLSYGGTSLVFMMAGLGLVFNISRYTVFDVSRRKGGSNADIHDGRRNRRPRIAYNSRSL